MSKYSLNHLVRFFKSLFSKKKPASPPPARRIGVLVTGPVTRLADVKIVLGTIEYPLTNIEGYTFLDVPQTLRTAHLFVTANGFAPYDVVADLPTIGTDLVVGGTVWKPNQIQMPPLVPLFTDLPALVAQGGVFVQANGKAFTAKENSDFNLLGRLVHEGESVVREVLADRKAVGFNMLRVWTRYGGDEVEPQHRANFEQGIGRLQPSENPELYTKIPVLARLGAEYGMYIEFTAYCGGAREDHWERLEAALQGLTNVLVDGMNEQDDYPHQVDVSTLYKMPGILCSRGSNVQQHTPPRPWMDYETMHTNASFQWWRKGGHNGMELSEGTDGIQASHVPLLVNENERPDNDPNVRHHEQAAAADTLLVAGRCFHSQSGKRSVVFTDFDRPYAEASVRGQNSVPLDCRAGGYRHRNDLEQPNAGETGERVYQRGYEDRCIVPIRP